MISVLLVEDERHKRDELVGYLVAHFKDRLDLAHADSVHSAYHAVAQREFGLIVLDIALPTFSGDGGGSERGHDQAFGGLEVLRALKSSGRKSNIIIITQHNTISVGGTSKKVANIAPFISKRYDQTVLGGIIYKYKSPNNEPRLLNLLGKIK